MSNRAQGTFVLDTWDAEKPYEERDGIPFTRVHVDKTFSGDLDGTTGKDAALSACRAGLRRAPG
ncbi:MAG: DUF3224 domain-containing protein [Actinoallomurus sp.]